MQDYSAQLEALLGDCVDKTLVEPLVIYQFERRIDSADPAMTLREAARDLVYEMRRHGYTRVNPFVRPTTHWLDVNCLFG
jgi:hypothetical protein